MPSNIDHPLLNSPSTNTCNLSSNILVFLISISALLTSCIFLAPHLINLAPAGSTPLHHLCHHAHHPQSCFLHISEAVAETQDHNTLTFLKYLLTKSLPQMKMLFMSNHDQDCMQLMDMSIDRTISIIAIISSTFKTQSHVDNAHTWLSAVLTNHFTCLEGLVDHTSQVQLSELISRTRTSLTLMASVSADNKGVLRSLDGGFPAWMSGRDRRLVGGSGRNIEADVVVAKDGSGKYESIQEAVEAGPDKSKRRYVIYVKKGIYTENVNVGKKKINVMIVGDGMDSTIITGSLNVVDGSTTFRSATLAVAGDGFILRDIRVENTAGPEKHQAVALRVSADQAVINRCEINAYQDTLYTHNLRQFYRDSLITGTVDFIFGNAAVVFQNCEIIARKPMENQKNMVTAQGRADPNQNTGISIQACEIIPSSDLDPVQDSVPTYLGRPWKEYSRTVVMQSYIGEHINPAGWAEWNKDFALKSLYYGEFGNRGPGAGTSERVKWEGYHVITNPNDAKNFTVAELIQGQAWLSSTGVSYTEGL